LEESKLLRIFFGVFIILHGLVFLLYFGQNQRLFELRPGMVWPDGSWAFSRLLGDSAVRKLASIALILAAIGFVTAGLGILLSSTWRRAVVVGAAVFSSLIIILFWDGKLHKLDDQGGIGLLINIAILIAAFVPGWI
jgi:uncharacterized membrane protein YphA (DoxX/SURF4 family)